MSLFGRHRRRQRYGLRVMVAGVSVLAVLLGMGAPAGAHPVEVAENLAWSCANSAFKYYQQTKKVPKQVLTINCRDWIIQDSVKEAVRLAVPPIVLTGVVLKKATTAQVKELLTPVLGFVLAQYENLSKLHVSRGQPLVNSNGGATVSAQRGGLIPFRLSPLDPDVAMAGAGTNDSTSNFVFDNMVSLTWCCNNLDGTAKFRLHRQYYKPRPDLDFWATSQAASVTPVNGAKLKELFAQVEPHASGLSLIEFDPISVASYGSGGTNSLSATLEGHLRGPGGDVGGNFSIGRTWNRPEGYTGGAALHDDSHYTLWRDNGKGSEFAKGIEGVETYAQATDAHVEWLVGAVAYYVR